MECQGEVFGNCTRCAISNPKKLYYFCYEHYQHSKFHVNVDSRNEIIPPKNIKKHEVQNCVECGAQIMTTMINSFDKSSGEVSNNEEFSLCSSCFINQSKIGSNNDSDEDDSSVEGEDINELLNVAEKFQDPSLSNLVKDSSDDNNLHDFGSDDSESKPLLGLRLSKSLHLRGPREYEESKNIEDETMDVVVSGTSETRIDSSGHDFSNSFPPNNFDSDEQNIDNNNDYNNNRKALKKVLKWGLGKDDINTVTMWDGEVRAFAKHVFNISNSMAPSDRNCPYYCEINIDRTDEVYMLSFFAKYNWVPMSAVYRKGRKNYGDGLPYISMCSLLHPTHGHRYILVAIDCSTCRRPITGFTLFDTLLLDSVGYGGFYLVRSDNADDMTAFNEFVGCDPRQPFDRLTIAKRYYHFCVQSKLLYDPKRGIQVVSAHYMLSNLNRNEVPKSEQFTESDPSFLLWYPINFYDQSSSSSSQDPSSAQVMSTAPFLRDSSKSKRISTRLEKNDTLKKQLLAKQLEELSLMEKNRHAVQLQALEEKVQKKYIIILIFIHN